MFVKSEEIATLIELFNTSDWDQLHVEIDGLQLFLSTDPNARLTSGGALPVQASPVVTPVAAPVAAAAPAPVPAAAPQAASGEIPANWVAIKAPNLGTFYRSPKPGAPAFVEIGQRVDNGAELCLLEVMKLFTTVTATAGGTIRRICVADADMVEHDQVLFWIEP